MAVSQLVIIIILPSLCRRLTHVIEANIYITEINAEPAWSIILFNKGSDMLLGRNPWEKIEILSPLPYASI